MALSKICDQCSDPRVYIKVEAAGSLCHACYDLWYEGEVLPGLKRLQTEWRDSMNETRGRLSSLRTFDESMAQLVKRKDDRRIVDVQLPEWGSK